MFKHINEEICSIMERDPAAKSAIEVILLYPGFHAVIAYWIAHWFYNRKIFFIARVISQLVKFITGIEIHPGAKIGKGLFIDHGTGVVIGETTEIGDNVTIYQGATLGGTGKDKGKRHPTIGNNVLISTGAKVLGPIKIGDNSRIGANAVVLSEVPPNSTAVGVLARVVNGGSKKANVVSNLDHAGIPDPISQEIHGILVRIENLERRLGEFKNHYKIKKMIVLRMGR